MKRGGGAPRVAGWRKGGAGRSGSPAGNALLRRRGCASGAGRHPANHCSGPPRFVLASRSA